jgi:hypothetical protein
VIARQIARLALFVLLLAAACGTRNDATPAGVPLCGLENAAWTVEARLLRAGRPRLDEFDCLAQAGVGVVVDQLPDGERDPAEAETAAKAGIEYLNLGLPDDTAPSPALLKEWLDTVDERLAQGKVVLVHDAAGRGRIGFWEAAYLMHKGTPAQQAIEDRYLGKALPFKGAKIGCADGGNGQVQALAEVATALGQPPYTPAVDEYGTTWGNCPRPAYMEGWDYRRAVTAP